MMYVDAETMFSEKQAVTASADSTNIVDSGGVDYGKGEPVSLYVHADGYTGGTLKVDLKTSHTLAGQNLSAPDTLATFNVTAAQMTKGGQVVAAALPQGCKRYLGLSYTATGGGTNGFITAGLNMGTHTND